MLVTRLETRPRIAPEELLERVALPLNSSLELRDVLRSLAELVLETAGADRCSLFLLEGGNLRPTVAIGSKTEDALWSAFRSMGTVDLDLIPGALDLIRAGRALPIEDAMASPFVPTTWAKRFGLRALVLVPLLASGEPCGLMAVDSRVHGAFGPEDVRLLESIGAAAGVAIRNARLYEAARDAARERAELLEDRERHLRRLRMLYGLSAQLAEGLDAALIRDRLNELFADDGVEIRSVAFRDRRTAARLGGEQVTPEERAAWKRGRDHVVLDDGILSIAMRLGRRRLGALRIHAPGATPELVSFLHAVAWGVGEVASLGVLRSEAEDDARARAVAAERGRIAEELHDTVGQILVAAGLLAQRMAEHIPDDSPLHDPARRIRELAETGKWEIDHAVRALAFVPAATHGIGPALAALTSSFERDSGIPVLLDVSGTATRLGPRAERALYRVTNEALANAWRHSRCTAIRVDLAFEDREVALRVVDDGIGLGTRGTPGTPGFGVAGMRRAVDEVGGTFRVRAGSPRGVVVEAHIGREDR